jgi:hypothetical protein
MDVTRLARRVPKDGRYCVGRSSFESVRSCFWQISGYRNGPKKQKEIIFGSNPVTCRCLRKLKVPQLGNLRKDSGVILQYEGIGRSLHLSTQYSSGFSFFESASP